MSNTLQTFGSTCVGTINDMYSLTYKQNDGYPVKLVFDSEEEAQYWGMIYSILNDSSTYKVKEA